jgi:hypothetical protein
MNRKDFKIISDWIEKDSTVLDWDVATLPY